MADSIIRPTGQGRKNQASSPTQDDDPKERDEFWG